MARSPVLVLEPGEGARHRELIKMSPVESADLVAGPVVSKPTAFMWYGIDLAGGLHENGDAA